MNSPEIPEDAEVRAITDHNGNICGYLFGKELPWPLIDMIVKKTPTTGYHGVNYHIKSLKT